MNFHIIPTSEEHIEGFNQALDSIAREKKYLPFLQGDPIEITRPFVVEQLAKKNPHFVALIDSAVVGWCDIRVSDRLLLSHTGVLGMGVLSSVRGQGIGKKLLQTGLDAARSRGLTRVELVVRQGNLNAVGLYRSFGFKQEGVHTNALRLEGTYEDLISMALLFS